MEEDKRAGSGAHRKRSVTLLGACIGALLLANLMVVAARHGQSDTRIAASAPTTTLPTTSTVAPSTTATTATPTTAVALPLATTTTTIAPRVTTAPRPTRPVGPSISGSILFISRATPPPPTSGPVTPGPQGYEIWAMDGNGGHQRSLTSTNADTEPTLSPDGRTIVWVRYSSQLWEMGSNGTGKRQIASCPSNCQFPTWSPDGTRIAYVESNATAGDIVIVSAVGGSPQRFHSGVDHYRVGWSPDSTRLAFTGYAASHGLWVLDLRSGTEKKIQDGYDTEPSWSPDGKVILFADDHSGLSSVAPDGSALRKVTSGSGQYLGGHWSPDGGTIVFDYSAGTSTMKEQVGVMTADGSNIRMLTDGTVESYESTY